MLPVVVSAQSEQKQLDSLQIALKNTANDTIRMNVYNLLGLFYLEINFDSSLVYLNHTIPLAQKLKLKINEANALGTKGYTFFKMGNYPRSLESFLQALKIAEDPASEKYTWNLPKGQTSRNARLDALGYIYHNMGHLYGATGNNKKQVANYYMAINLGESVQDSFLISLANMNLGDVYLRLNKLDSALVFEQKALSFISVKKYEGVILNIIGDIYRQKGNFNEALIYYRKALQANTEQNNLTSLGGSYSDLAELYTTLQKPDSSLFYAGLALKNANIIGQPQYMARAYKRLSDVYNSQQNRDSTLKYLQLSSALNDSLNNVEKQNLLAYQNIGFDEQIRLQKLEEERIQTQSRNRTYILLAGLTFFMLIAFLLYRNNKIKQKANKILQEQKEEIQTTLEQLESTQSQLIQSEKMASLGELTAGIAHEIQNPLNFVNNFSELSKELIGEMNDELAEGSKQYAAGSWQAGEEKLRLAEEMANDIKQNLEKINHHGKRAADIVKGMLLHSRTSNGKKEPTDINALADEYLRLAYHGFRAKDKSFNADFKTEFDESLPKINVIPQDIGRVLLNLINNAFYAVQAPPPSRSESGTGSEGGFKDPNYIHKPMVIVKTSLIIPPSGGTTRPDDPVGRGGACISISDNGPGIPQNIVDKIFQPFFTTKPTGQGTGLGLSLSYDIVKAHGGALKVETRERVGSEFIIQIPI